jgi:hypothetical protein
MNPGGRNREEKSAFLWQNSVVHSLGIVLFFSFLFTAFFSPVLLADGLLAPGDGFIQSVPAFYAPLTLWTDLLLAGFPAAADPTIQSWYPLRLFFSQFHAWNGFVISAYVLAACFTYGYVYTLTKSSLSGSVSGIVYSMSGFMMAHLGHTSMVHSALWAPLLIWSLEKLRHHFTAFWFVVGALSVSCNALAGHPQIFIYSLGIGTLYAVVFGWSAALGRWKYYCVCSGLSVVGLGLAAIQLLPTAELAKLGPRAEMSFAEFVSVSLPPYQAITLIFPYLFGGSPWSLYNLPYFGHANPTELSGYIGLLPLLTAAAAIVAYRWQSVPLFWLVIGVLAFLLTLGDTTPLAKILFQLPVYNKFRVPARHFFEMSLAVSILAGFGILLIRHLIITEKQLLIIISSILCIISLMLIFIFINYDKIQALALKNSISNLSILPWSNPCLIIPIVVFFTGNLIVLYWCKLPTSYLRQTLLLSIFIIDLGSFGWFYEWKYEFPSQAQLVPSEHIKRYRDLLDTTGQRILPLNGGHGSMTEMPVNISRLWGIRSAGGYGPLLLTGVRQLLSMAPAGVVDSSWTAPTDRSLDIMAVRYISLSRRDLTPQQPLNRNGFSWTESDLPIALGSGCGSPSPNFLKLLVPMPFNATSIGIVSAMRCSTEVPNAVPVIRLLLKDVNNNIATNRLLAGRATSEWAYDCEDVLPAIQHDRAAIFESYPMIRDGFAPCDGHKYLAVVPLLTETKLKEIGIEWTGPTGGIAIQKLSLLNEATGESFPLSAVESALADSSRWRYVETLDDSIIYENIRVLGRVRLVPEVLTLELNQILQAIKFSTLPDGQAYDPTRMALIEKPILFPSKSFDPFATAEIILASNTQVTVRTNSTSWSFLVLSDLYYPGWTANIDKVATHIYRTDYALRGVVVPNGEHIVQFQYQPKKFYIGIIISLSSILLLTVILIHHRKNEKNSLES